MYNLITRDFDNFDKIFNNFLAPTTFTNGKKPSLLKEEDGTYFLGMEVPGVPPNNVQISVEGRVLTVRATVSREETNGLLERKFERSWTLPHQVSVDDITAKVEHGLLTLSLPKHESHKVKSIPIST